MLSEPANSMIISHTYGGCAFIQSFGGLSGWGQTHGQTDSGYLNYSMFYCLKAYGILWPMIHKEIRETASFHYPSNINNIQMISTE